MPTAKKRKIGTIWRNLQKFLNAAKPDVVKPDEPLSKYIGGPHNDQNALIAALNRHPPFERDDVSLTPNNVPRPASVADLFTAVVIEYARNGWKVIQ